MNFDRGIQNLFNSQFEEFVNDIMIVYPNDIDIKTLKLI